MGEAFLGLPNRFRLIGRSSYGGIDSTTGSVASSLQTEDSSTYNEFNPDHGLSAYYGYRLATEYVNRKGGEDFKMVGTFYTQTVRPTKNEEYNLGTTSFKYNNVYGKSFSGNSATTTKLATERTITVKLESETTDQNNCSGGTAFNGSKDITITVPTPYLHLSGGTLSGTLTVNDKLSVTKNGIEVTGDSKFSNNLSVESALTVSATTTTTTILPSKNNSYSIGSDNMKYAAVRATNLYGALTGDVTGNASSASKLATPRSITVNLTQETNTANYGAAQNFDGSANITINVPTPYLHLSGGTLQGGLTIGSAATAANLDINGSLKIVNGHIDYQANLSGGYLGYMQSYINNDYGTPSVILRLGSTAVGNSPIKVNLNNGYIESSLNFFNYGSAAGHDITGVGTIKGGAGAVKLDCGHPNTGGRRVQGIIKHLAVSEIVSMGLFDDSIQKDLYIVMPTGSNDDGPFLNIVAHSSKSGGTNQAWNYDISTDKKARVQIFGWLKANGAITGSAQLTTSDIRLKSDVTVIPKNESVGLISKLTPTKYIKDDRKDRGFIAQQVKTAFIGTDFEDYVYATDGSTRMMGYQAMNIQYTQLIPDLVNAVKYLLAKVDVLEVQAGVKGKLEHPELQQEDTFDEAYYREHAQEIAEM